MQLFRNFNQESDKKRDKNEVEIRPVVFVKMRKESGQKTCKYRSKFVASRSS